MTRKSSTNRPVDYHASIENLANYGDALKGLLKSLLHSEEINYQSIDYRVKEKTSAEKKIGLKPDRYTDFRSLTDLLGVRIITYFNDEVDKVAKLLEREFKVDEANSIDKRLSLEPNQFGYLSLHYILELNRSRSALVEYAPYKGIKFEIQIRSTLQHAWAEIEHDLGYKAKSILPKEIRRRFFRVAGLLEIADDEFKALRDRILEYENEVAEQISGPLVHLSLDSTTVDAYIRNSVTIKKLDTAIISLTNPPGMIMDHENAGPDYAEMLQLLDFSNMAQVDDALTNSSKEIVEFARYFNAPRDDSDTGPRILPLGVSVYLYYYVQLAKKDRKTRIEMIDIFGIPDTDVDMIASRIEYAWDRMNSDD